MNRRQNGRTRLTGVLGSSLLLACLASGSALLLAASRPAPVPDLYADEVSGDYTLKVYLLGGTASAQRVNVPASGSVTTTF